MSDVDPMLSPEPAAKAAAPASWLEGLPRRDWSDYERSTGQPLFWPNRRWPMVTCAVLFWGGLLVECLLSYLSGRGDGPDGILLGLVVGMVMLGSGVATLFLAATALYYQRYVRTAVLSIVAPVLLLVGVGHFSPTPFQLGLKHRAGNLGEFGAACQELLAAATIPVTQMEGDDPQLPPVIRATRPSFVVVNRREQVVGVEIGNSWNAFGYVFERATDGDGRWKLSVHWAATDVTEIARF